MRGLIRTVGFIGVGLLLGIGLGLYLGWVAWPTEFTNADPSLLAEPYRQDYALMIATAYERDRDLAAARWRVTTLDVADPQAWLLRFTVDTILAGQDEAAMRRLARLSGDLGLRSPAITPYLSTEDG
ncbi:MAG: hypothetical protein KC418_07475 [Anaerolineales bacterium]|nr:hypothetical protein [Anaerolineales bacterium]MCB8950435.1 hypothetical protein [Ardenticatenales bacterium]